MSRILAAVAVILAVNAPRPLPAQSDSPGKTAKAKPPGRKADQTVKAKQPPGRKPDVARLLKQVDGEQVSPQDLIEQTIASMRSAGERIGGQDTGEQTRKLQSDVVANLEKLIEIARQSQSSPHSSRKTSQSRKTALPTRKTRHKSPADTQPAIGNPNGGQPNNKKAAESSRRNHKAAQQAEAKQRIARRRALIKEIWGHLPDSVRQRLQNIKNESYLPRYSGLIREYFESLAK